MDVGYINPFIASTRSVFETMIKVPFQLGRPYLKKGNERLYKMFRLSAQLAFSGPAEIFFVLNVTETAVMSVVSGLTGTPVSDLTEDCCDAIGEVANMIANGAKKDLPAKGFKVSIPRVIRPHRVEYPARLPIVAIPADTGAGRFMIEIGMRHIEATTAEPDVGPAAASAAA